MILWFSGTGNSYIVARMLSKALGDTIHRMDLSNASAINLATAKRIIWVMPVHSWGMPKAVVKYIQQVQIEGGESAEHYLVATCGDDAGLTAERWRKELRRRGWKAKSAFTVEMPNTYVLLPGFDTDSDDVAHNKLKKSIARIDEIVDAIKHSTTNDSIVKGQFAWFKTYVIYPLFMHFMMSPKPFYATKRCIGCGLCEKVCPLKNIHLDAKTKKPHWDMDCTQCLGCYHVCPRNAVKYGKATNGKGQWREAIKSLLSDINKGNTL